MLAPVDFTSLQAFMAGLSDAEQACLSENVNPDLLMSLVMGTDPVTADEGAAMVGCLESETMLRLFLTPILAMTGPLIPESAGCIRDSFTDVDLAVLMIAQIGESASDEDMEALDVAAMLSIFVALTCLSEDEFRAVGPIFEMTPEDREGLQCMLDELGGPERIASLMGPNPDTPVELFLFELFGASLECEVEIPGSG